MYDGGRFDGEPTPEPFPAAMPEPDRLDEPRPRRRPDPRTGLLADLLPQNLFATILVVGAVLVIFIVLLLNR